MTGGRKRELDLLRWHAADLFPLEMAWTGTPRSPQMLIETPYRQLISFWHFDPDFSDTNMLVAAASGHGKSMMTGQMLLQAARQATRVRSDVCRDLFNSEISSQARTHRCLPNESRSSQLGR